MKKLLAASLLAASVSLAHANIPLGSPLLMFSFGDSQFTDEAMVAPSASAFLSASPMAGGFENFATFGGFNYSLAGNGSFSFTIDSPNFINISSLTFATVAAPTAVSSWEIVINGVSQGSGATAPFWSTQGLVFSPEFSTISSSTTIEIVGSGASSDASVWFIDNLQLSGSIGAVIPEASTYALIFGLVGLGLALWRRKK